MEKLFNEWMRRFIESPMAFCHEWQTVATHLKELSDGKEPSYGRVCVAYLSLLSGETLFPEEDAKIQAILK